MIHPLPHALQRLGRSFAKLGIVGMSAGLAVAALPASPASAMPAHFVAPYRTLPAHDFPADVAVGRVDAGATLDVVVVNRNSSDLSIFPGMGDGTFEIGPRIPTLSLPSGITHGDLNEDGWEDWVVYNASSSTATVHWGTASGPGSSTSIALASGIVSCGLTHLDGDGHLDLVAVRTPNLLSRWLGTGAGTFGARVDYVAGTDPMGIASGDLDGDGDTDLVVGHTTGTSVAVFYGNGIGTLAPAVNVATTSAPRSVACVDLNDDGRLDLVTNGTVRLGDPAGGFQSLMGFNLPGSTLAIADANRDGRPDVLTTSLSGLAVLLGDGYGRFLPATTTPIGINPGPLVAADFDGNGSPDVVAISDNDTYESPIAIAFGVGDGTFPPLRTVPLPSGIPNAIRIGDVDGNGSNDLVVGTETGFLYTLLGNGRGEFPGRVNGSGLSLGWLRLGDFDEDTRLDLVEADGGGFWVRPGAGDGSFAAGTYTTSGPIVGDIDVGDVNANQNLDVVTTYNKGGIVHLGNGNGTMQSGISVPTASLSYQTEGVQLGDVNGDGRDDLVAFHFDRSPSVVLTGAGPTFSLPYPFATTTLVKNLAIGDLDHNGHLDIITTYPGDDAGAMWHGHGDGGFDFHGSFDVGADHTPVVGNFNMDDSLEFAVLNGFRGTVAIHAGHGHGMFDRIDFGVGRSCRRAMESGDLDSDGIDDLAIALGDSRVALLLSGGPMLPVASSLQARIVGAGVQVVWTLAEPTRWAEVAVERAAGGDGSWERLALTLVSAGDSTFADDPSPPGGSIWYRLAARLPDGQWITSGPVPARDELVPALVSLESARVEGGRVRLRWIDASRTLGAVTVERAHAGEGWVAFASARADASGVIEHVDENVSAGGRYGYRLAFEDEGERRVSGETWVEIPAAIGLELAAESPQPAGEGLVVRWAAPRAGDLTLRVFDLAGREVSAHRLHASAPARRTERFGTRLVPGVYLVTLADGSRRLTKRVVVTR